MLEMNDKIHSMCTLFLTPTRFFVCLFVCLFLLCTHYVWLASSNSPVGDGGRIIFLGCRLCPGKQTASLKNAFCFLCPALLNFTSIFTSYYRLAFHLVKVAFDHKHNEEEIPVLEVDHLSDF
jgi:hypothetical protein